jgi:hypothetical protein
MQERMVVEVECALQIQIPRNLTQRCRIHLLSNVLNDIQWNNESANREMSSDLIATLQRKLMRALRFGAVGVSTFDHKLSQTEAAELLTTLLWETGGMLKLGRPNVAIVGAGEPIDVRQYLTEYSSKKKTAMEKLKNALKEQINSRLAQLNSIHRGEPID